MCEEKIEDLKEKTKENFETQLKALETKFRNDLTANALKLESEIKTVIQLAFQKGKRVKLFDAFQVEVEALEKKLISNTNSQTYSIIEDSFQETKDLDQSFKQELIDRTNLMDPTKRLKLCAIDFAEMKKGFLKEEEELFKKIETKLAEAQDAKVETSKAPEPQPEQTVSKENEGPKENQKAEFANLSIDALYAKVAKLAFPNEYADLQFSELQANIF